MGELIRYGGHMTSSTEPIAFSRRLRSALDAIGVRQSPTVVANEFNLRYWGRSITPHTARNWLLGKAIPTQDKLRTLADWLQVSPDELRFGQGGKTTFLQEASTSYADLDMADREMLNKYLSLSRIDRKVIRDVVQAFSAAGTNNQA
jgi:transcriptional regulator with XRE-family HTH domain